MENAKLRVIRFDENDVIATSGFTCSRNLNEHVLITGTWNSEDNTVPGTVFKYNENTGTWDSHTDSYPWYDTDPTPSKGEYYYWGGNDDDNMYLCDGNHISQ